MARVRAVGVIPARFGSRRFPGKPLAPIAGRPLVRWVWEGSLGATRLERLIVATDHSDILEACRSFGAEAVLTSAHHPSGTDRVAEVAAGLPMDIVVNIQGDEPLIEGKAIDCLVAALEEDPHAPMATLAHPADPEAFGDPNRVRVVVDRLGYALSFSRFSSSARSERTVDRAWQHVGLYAYRQPFLLELVKLEPTSSERKEGLEQLRVLDHGHRIRTVSVETWRSLPVDVPDDVGRVEARLRELGRC